MILIKQKPTTTNLQMIKAFAEHPRIDFKIQNHELETALIVAVKNNNTEAVKFINENLLEINERMDTLAIRDKNKRTALWYLNQVEKEQMGAQVDGMDLNMQQAVNTLNSMKKSTLRLG